MSLTPSAVLERIRSGTYSESTANALNSEPTANAGPDQTKEEDIFVTLNGLNSSDPDSGDALSYEWIQIAGTSVTTR